MKSSPQVLNLSQELKNLTRRAHTAHKGDFGHVLVIGGDYGMGGAVRMAAEAAARGGAGLVSAATRPEHRILINVSRPEIMVHGIETANQLSPLLSKATVIVLGPGLGLGEWGRMIFQAVMTTSKSLIIDADALNILSSENQKRDNLILTPHPGEAARLLGGSVQEIQANRIQTAQRIQNKFGGVCVLKGAGTLVTSKGEKVWVCNAGNPGMASGGMGDILSGIIGALVAQGLNLSDAAKLGVLVHATAGDIVAQKKGEVGMLAMDLLPVIRKILNFGAG